MFSDPLLILAVVACFIVLGILAFGIGGFAKGSEFNQKHANKVMRYRLGAQLVAVILIVAFVFFRNMGAN
ncbi:twin transmembrane helix small protein [Parasulfitobacter algicola]|uniref:Twin transmembrane helix small protein n=1 Tax=Parasulfitobacter algicola TaxID=2614809 RepID=A0ABX2IUE3_9RHOB|nr:twin transmembrane helix small protein [Sulfitobacter algicola]NSX55631.1 twin transmembrane helix small protein [Sulfitobacter algicola]